MVRKFASDEAVNAHCENKNYHEPGNVDGYVQARAAHSAMYTLLTPTPAPPPAPPPRFHSANDPVFAAITFDSYAPQWSYNIRYNATLVPLTLADDQLRQFDRGTNMDPEDLYIAPDPQVDSQIPTTCVITALGARLRLQPACARRPHLSCCRCAG